MLENVVYDGLRRVPSMHATDNPVYKGKGCTLKS